MKKRSSFRANQRKRSWPFKSPSSSYSPPSPPVPPPATVKRETLPLEAHLPQLVELVKTHKIISLSANTGSGKTTLLPPALVYACQAQVLVLSPMVESCYQLARFVQQQHPNLNIGTGAGGEVCYNYQTDIAFVTAGHIQYRLLNAKDDLRPFSIVMLDEAHCVSAEYEMVDALFRARWNEWNHLTFILCSATPRASLLQDWEDLLGGQSTMPRYEVSVARFPIEQQWLDEDPWKAEKPYDCTSLIARAVERLVEENQNQPAGHFMIFLPGQEQIQMLIQRASSIPDLANCTLVPVHAGLPASELMEAFHPPSPQYFRRWILIGTDVMETSVTVQDVVLVMDSGLQKLADLGPTGDLEALVLGCASRFAVTQRMGRTGRTNPGTMIHLYTKDFWEQLPEVYAPALLRTPLYRPVLELLQHRIVPRAILGQFAGIGEETVDGCIRHLFRLNLLVESKHDVHLPHLNTEAKHIAPLKLRLELAKSLYHLEQQWNQDRSATHRYKIGILMVAIAQIHSGGMFLPFLPKRGKQMTEEEYEELKLNIAQLQHPFTLHSSCVMQSAVHAFLACERDRAFVPYRAGTWCTEHGINRKTLMAIHELVSRLHYFHLRWGPDGPLLPEQVGPLFEECTRVFQAAHLPEKVFDVSCDGRGRETWVSAGIAEKEQKEEESIEEAMESLPWKLAERGFAFDGLPYERVLALSQLVLPTARQPLGLLSLVLPLPPAPLKKGTQKRDDEDDEEEEDEEEEEINVTEAQSSTEADKEEEEEEEEEESEGSPQSLDDGDY